LVSEAYCHQRGIKVDEWMQDIGSGLNYKRKQFNRLMEMVELGQVRRMVIAHRDRLVRFGYGYFEAFCEQHNTEVAIIDGATLSPEQELVQDLVAILTVFSARLHGLRSYKKVTRMLLCKKIKLNVTEQDAVTLEFMQGKCRGLYNWWVMKLKSGEKWPGWRMAKKTLQDSKRHDPELCQVYGKLLHEVYFRLGAAMGAFFAG